MSGIQVRGLAKRFGTRTAVEGLTFDVLPGEVFGLLGPNGAGKTTTVRMLTGLLQPTEGEATVGGYSIRTDGEALRGAVGLLTEQPGLYERLTARENLRFFMKLHELDEAATWPRVRSYLERFGLAGREDEACGGFSKGMRQKLAIVRTLVHGPQVIFLDEPTSGLDPESARVVRDAVAELASEGRTIVLCSHNLAEVERLCSRVAIIQGRLLALAPLGELRRAGLSLEVRVEGEAERFVTVLDALPFKPHVLSEGGKLRVLLTEESQAPDVLACLVNAGARVHSAIPAHRPLEEVYLELIRQGRV
ncbi:ABC transporter ATP-binding protein [Stigmatella sp. ncwal1]|uniref:ABC transporter ATP-binding protein n=1 Tax=Stigmatella ashevillensis TaxID=2995309 RepID=A0ABT5D955_9BACT|nr:ABC transporter ATP-binding protein [Stigmatella ashevillena]MDC0709569.1 ABC transporter ATP-binding protein [Stigmatella ashevillena]